MLQFISPEVARLLKLTSAYIILQNTFTFPSFEVDPHVEITLPLPNAQASITETVFRFHFYYRLDSPDPLNVPHKASTQQRRSQPRIMATGRGVVE